jgi:hypothetical protein
MDVPGPEACYFFFFAAFFFVPFFFAAFFLAAISNHLLEIVSVRRQLGGSAVTLVATA